MSAVVEMNPEPRRDRAVGVSPNPYRDIVQTAMKTGNADVMRQAIDFAKELEGLAARKAFDNAMADAKAEIKPVVRNATGHNSKKYADFAAIARAVDPIISKHGLSYRFRTTQTEKIAVTCILSHRDGHYEESTLTGPPDPSGNKSAIHAIGSTLTYLQRYSLVQALGLAASDDDDGRRASEAATEPAAYTPPPGSITQDQADLIRDALDDKGASRTAFIQWAAQKQILPAGRKLVDDIPAEHFDACMTAISNFRKV